MTTSNDSRPVCRTDHDESVKLDGELEVGPAEIETPAPVECVRGERMLAHVLGEPVAIALLRERGFERFFAILFQTTGSVRFRTIERFSRIVASRIASSIVSAVAICSA